MIKLLRVCVVVVTFSGMLPHQNCFSNSIRAPYLMTGGSTAVTFAHEILRHVENEVISAREKPRVDVTPIEQNYYPGAYKYFLAARRLRENCGATIRNHLPFRNFFERHRTTAMVLAITGKIALSSVKTIIAMEFGYLFFKSDAPTWKEIACAWSSAVSGVALSITDIPSCILYMVTLCCNDARRGNAVASALVRRREQRQRDEAIDAGDGQLYNRPGGGI